MLLIFLITLSRFTHFEIGKEKKRTARNNGLHISMTSHNAQSLVTKNETKTQVIHDHDQFATYISRDIIFVCSGHFYQTVKMFKSGPNYNKLKTNLRLTINRLKLLEKKKTELALKARKEIADYISAGKEDRARIRVEHIIREDYLVEAMELLEMYCDLLLARFGLIQTQK